MINWDNYPSFTRKEFSCKHSGKCDMQPEFMDKLQSLRNEYNKPITITSGYRDVTHPIEAVKGHSRGEHTLGVCCDVACTTGVERYQLITLALKHGFTRLGVADTFLHIGIGADGLPQHVIWTY